MVSEDADSETVTDDATVTAGTDVKKSEPLSPALEGSLTPEVLPPAKRTGLIVVVAALLLLLVAGVAGAMLLVPAFRSTKGTTSGDATATKIRVEAAIGVMKALRTNDLAAVRPFLVDAANKAITDAQWAEAAAASEVSSATFSPTIWSGETTASVDYTIDGATGTMTFAPNPDQPNTVTMTEIGVDGTLVYDVQLIKVGTAWRATVLTPRAEPFNLDAEFVKSLIATDTP